MNRDNLNKYFDMDKFDALGNIVASMAMLKRTEAILACIRPEYENGASSVSELEDMSDSLTHIIIGKMLERNKTAREYAATETRKERGFGFE